MTDPNILSRPEIQTFIKANEGADVAKLALQKPPHADWPYRDILEQIKSRQKARRKLPDWCEIEGLIFPTPDIIEQASSRATSRYKASLIAGRTIIDLTAGSGADSYAFSAHFQEISSIEQDEKAAKILKHNAKLLSSKKWKIFHICAEDFLKTAPKADLIYIDPQRRDENRKGLFRFADCSPDITALLPELTAIAPYVMIKAAPMLDTSKALEELPNCQEIHILQWQGQCREILFILGEDVPGHTDDIPIIAVSLDDEGNIAKKLRFTKTQEKQAMPSYGAPAAYLYEPDAAFMKSGAFNLMSEQYGLSKLHPATHLYTSDALVVEFPGRIFKITGTYPAQSKKLPLKQANLTVRNFPISAPELQKKLKLKDGGTKYLFACTLSGSPDSRVLIEGEKI